MFVPLTVATWPLTQVVGFEHCREKPIFADCPLRKSCVAVLQVKVLWSLFQACRKSVCAVCPGEPAAEVLDARQAIFLETTASAMLAVTNLKPSCEKATGVELPRMPPAFATRLTLSAQRELNCRVVLLSLLKV